MVDSSTGRTLGECTTQSHGTKWVKFSWALAADSMQCTVSPTNSSRVVFPAAPGPRVFSVRIQAGTVVLSPITRDCSGRGPACIRQMIVQNEKPIGCPPHLARNSFSSMHFACSCPYEINSSEEQAGEIGRKRDQGDRKTRKTERQRDHRCRETDRHRGVETQRQ